MIVQGENYVHHNPKFLVMAKAYLFATFDPNISDLFDLYVSTVRPRDIRPQSARTSQVHVFELVPKKFEMNEFMK